MNVIRYDELDLGHGMQESRIVMNDTCLLNGIRGSMRALPLPLPQFLCYYSNHSSSLYPDAPAKPTLFMPCIYKLLSLLRAVRSLAQVPVIILVILSCCCSKYPCPDFHRDRAN